MRARAVFLLIPFLAGCMGTMNVRVPGASWLGIGPAIDVEIGNFQPLYVKVVVLGKEVARLKPASTAHGRWHVAFDYEELPVAFLQYRDSLYTDFVGVSGTVLYGQEGSAGGIYLEVGQERGRNSRGGYLSTPLPRGKRWSINLPTIRFESATALQFVNCELYRAIVTYAGEQVTLKQGDYFSDEVFARDFGYRYRPRGRGLVRVEFEDNKGRIVGWRHYYYDLNTGWRRGPRAYQYFLRLS